MIPARPRGSCRILLWTAALLTVVPHAPAFGGIGGLMGQLVGGAFDGSIDPTNSNNKLGFHIDTTHFLPPPGPETPYTMNDPTVPIAYRVDLSGNVWVISDGRWVRTNRRALLRHYNNGRGFWFYNGKVYTAALNFSTPAYQRQVQNQVAAAQAWQREQAQKNAAIQKLNAINQSLANASPQQYGGILQGLPLPELLADQKQLGVMIQTLQGEGVSINGFINLANALGQAIAVVQANSQPGPGNPQGNPGGPGGFPGNPGGGFPGNPGGNPGGGGFPGNPGGNPGGNGNPGGPGGDPGGNPDGSGGNPGGSGDPSGGAGGVPGGGDPSGGAGGVPGSGDNSGGAGGVPSGGQPCPGASPSDSGGGQPCPGGGQASPVTPPGGSGDAQPSPDGGQPCPGGASPIGSQPSPVGPTDAQPSSVDPTTAPAGGQSAPIDTSSAPIARRATRALRDSYAANLGIHYVPVPYPDGTFGARITRTPDPRSPAGHAGMEIGDTIVELDDQRFHRPEDVLAHKDQTSVDLINVRNNQTVRLNIFIP